MYIKIISQEFEKYITSIFHWGVLQVRNYKKLSLKVLLSIYYFVTNFVKSIIFFLEQTLSQFVLTLYYFLSFLPRLSYFQGHRRQWWKFFRRWDFIYGLRRGRFYFSRAVPGGAHEHWRPRDQSKGGEVSLVRQVGPKILCSLTFFK